MYFTARYRILSSYSGKIAACFLVDCPTFNYLLLSGGYSHDKVFCHWLVLSGLMIASYPVVCMLGEGGEGESADVNIFALHKVEGLIQDYLRSHWGEKA